MDECERLASVGIGGTFVINGLTATLTAEYVLTDPIALGTTRAALFLYEDNISYGGRNWVHILRKIEYQTVTLTNVGDRVTVSKQIALNPAWNANELHAVAILEKSVNPKMIYQATRLPHSLDFSATMYDRMASIPQGNGTALFSGGIMNIGSASDVLTLSAAQVYGWTVEFQVAGDPNWYTSLSVPMDSGTLKDVTLRVQTDGVKRIGVVNLTVSAASTGRSQDVSVRVFNAGYAVLLVDDDGGHITGGVPDEVIYKHALDNLGYLYDHWDVQNGHGGVSPGLSAISFYDAILWETAYVTSAPLTTDDIAALTTYLETGGKLYLNSMDFLTSQTNPSPFVNDYLGVATWTNNTKANTVTGVGGDPITNGMVLPLTWPAPSANRVDTVNPTSSASAIFFSETSNPAALRTELPSHARVVFSTVIQNVISETAPAPNNSQTLIERTMNWLLEAPTGVVDPSPAGVAALIAAHPNPFHPRTELSFRLSPQAASGPVQLTLIDPAGRTVKTLVSGILTPGLHVETWDGTDNGSRPVASGIYFAKLKSLEGETSTKLVLTR